MDIISHIIAIVALACLAAGWMGVQILAKKMKIKNHIDQTSGCCGACQNRDKCERNGKWKVENGKLGFIPED